MRPFKCTRTLKIVVSHKTRLKKQKNEKDKEKVSHYFTNNKAASASRDLYPLV